MVIIINDDDTYTRWLEDNPGGFVLNAENPPRAAMLKLHRTSCRHISRPEGKNWTTTGYMKICSNLLAELEKWARQTVNGTLDPCPVCKPLEPRAVPSVPDELSPAAAQALPFASYPELGRQLIGRRSMESSRCGYGLSLMRLTKQTSCAYCGMDLASAYEKWLTLQVDHAVPTTMGKRLGIPAEWLEDYANLVLACSACNGFANRFDDLSVNQPPSTLDEFFDLRDRIFTARKPRILACHEDERKYFENKPWQN